VTQNVTKKYKKKNYKDTDTCVCDYQPFEGKTSGKRGEAMTIWEL